MFGTIRKHQQWLWVVIIAAMSVSLVVFFTDAPGKRLAREGGGEFGSIKGKPITVEQFLDARKEVFLFYFMNNHRWPGNEEGQDRTLQRETLYRFFMIQKMAELDIHVSEKAVGLFMSQLIGDTPRERFEAEVLAQAKMRWEDFDRFARHQVGLQQLLNVAGLSGRFVDPKEAEDVLRAESEEFNALVAVFCASNYLDQAVVTPDDIAKFYTNRMGMYRVPERVQVSYVAFAATNFFADADKRISEITNFEANIADFYLKRGTNAFKDDTGKVLSEAEAKAKIKAETRHDMARQTARRKAAEFGNELIEQPDPNKLGNLEKLAAAKGLPVQITPPFDNASGLDDTNFPTAFAEEAFSLTTNQPIRFRPIVGDNAVFLISYNKRIPFELPPLEKVRDKVTADCKLAEAGSLARKVGTNFAASIVTNLAQGKSFADLCTQAKVPMITLPPVTEGTTSLTNVDERLKLQDLQRNLFDMKPGEASRYVPTRDGGWVTYLRSRTPASEAKIKEELPKFLANMRYYRYVEAFNKWLSKQAELSQLTPPREPTNAPPRATAPTSRPTTSTPRATTTKTPPPPAKK
jgi:hypothetical protein